MAILLSFINGIYFFINGQDVVVNFGLIAVSMLIIVGIINIFYDRGYNSIKMKIAFEVSNNRVAQSQFQETVGE